MIVPFRTLHLVPSVPCTTATLLQAPIVRSVPVTDGVLDIPWAFDLELTEGFYLLLALFVGLRLVLAAARRR